MNIPHSSLLSSLQNGRIKQLVKLRERHTRNESGLFLIEGYRELFRAHQAGYPIAEVYFSPSLFLGDNEEALLSSLAAQGALLFECTPALFSKISYRDRPDGLIAIAPQRRQDLHALSCHEAKKKGALHSPPPFYVVAEAIEKPGNLGTILRSSDAAHIDGLIVCDQCTDVYNPNVVRASVGTLFSVPIFETGSQETIAWLKDRGIAIAAATPSAKLAFTEANFCQPIAIAVGTEQLGLSAAWLEQATIQVRIPMNGVADSLNVAMATTLLLYEVQRQRGAIQESGR